MTRQSKQAEGKLAEMVIDVVAHTDLTTGEVVRLRRLFDAEYHQGFGEWDPGLPYGYAPHDLHVIARNEDEVVGHVGWARRAIDVGGRELAIAGVGGVLISDHTRGRRLGERLMNFSNGCLRKFAAVGEVIAARLEQVDSVAVVGAGELRNSCAPSGGIGVRSRPAPRRPPAVPHLCGPCSGG